MPMVYEPKVINIAKSIVDIATQTFIGVLPDIVTSEKRNKKNILAISTKKFI